MESIESLNLNQRYNDPGEDWKSIQIERHHLLHTFVFFYWLTQFLMLSKTHDSLYFHFSLLIISFLLIVRFQSGEFCKGMGGAIPIYDWYRNLFPLYMEATHCTLVWPVIWSPYMYCAGLCCAVLCYAVLCCAVALSVLSIIGMIRIWVCTESRHRVCISYFSSFYSCWFNKWTLFYSSHFGNFPICCDRQGNDCPNLICLCTTTRFFN